MSVKLTLYTRRECCLCEEMKAAIHVVAERTSVDVEEIDVDSSLQLVEQYGNEVPVLFINGRKAFKYRVAANELERRLRREDD